MKIKPEHYAVLKAAIEPLDTVIRREQYECGDFPRADLTKNYDKRYRWDLFYDAKLGNFIHDVYEYLDDSHIDTALKKIVEDHELPTD